MLTRVMETMEMTTLYNMVAFKIRSESTQSPLYPTLAIWLPWGLFPPLPPLQARYITNDFMITRRLQLSIDIYVLLLLTKEPATWPNIMGSTTATCSKKCSILGLSLNQANPTHLCLS